MQFGVCSLGLVRSGGMRHGDVKGGYKRGSFPSLQFSMSN